MPDVLNPQQRHKCMSNIRSKNTKPEVKLRKELFNRGYRYRINVKSLPGSPDVVLAKHRTCIFVNGCFWHGHKGCNRYVQPKSNSEFWIKKIEANRERDLRDYTFLEAQGWKVIVVWECELSKEKLSDTVEQIQRQLELNRKNWLDEKADRKKRREEWQAEMKKRKDLKDNILRDLKQSL